VTTPQAAAAALAREIAELVQSRRAAGRACVLGLAAGRSPLGVYQELARLHAEEGLSFAGVTTFNLDEYLGLDPALPASFRAWMQRHLFDHVDLPPEQAHVPPSDLAPEGITGFCRDYERALAAAGGIDLQLLGLGRNGHIAFNEPGSPRDSRTRAVELCAETRADCAAEFGGLERTPERAVTLGVATILEARRIRVLAFGTAKRDAVRRMLEGAVGPATPASYLRSHPDCVLYVDPAAAPGS
jgi:glucosamine-6-phosphate deaminase